METRKHPATTKPESRSTNNTPDGPFDDVRHRIRLLNEQLETITKQLRESQVSAYSIGLALFYSRQSAAFDSARDALRLWEEDADRILGDQSATPWQIKALKDQADDLVKEWQTIVLNIEFILGTILNQCSQEQRKWLVCYVGITRAREALYVLAPDHGADAFYDFKVCKTAGEVRSGMG